MGGAGLVVVGCVFHGGDGVWGGGGEGESNVFDKGVRRQVIRATGYIMLADLSLSLISPCLSSRPLIEIITRHVTSTSSQRERFINSPSPITESSRLAVA